MKAIPSHLGRQLGDRILDADMGDLKFPKPVDEKISDLARRTAVVGEKIIAAHGARVTGDAIYPLVQEPEQQPAQLFKLADLTRYWNPDWQLERAGFGGAGGGLGGIRGITFLAGDVLATYPRDDVRGVVLRREVTLGANPCCGSRQASTRAGRGSSPCMRTTSRS